MVRQGWLTPVRTEAGRGYALTERAVRRLDEAATRIYGHRGQTPWDGRWSIALLPHVADRSRRDRVHRALEYLGYRPFQPDVWVAPRPTAELAAAAAAEGVELTHFLGRLDGDDAELVARLYRPAELRASYVAWHEEAAELLGAGDPYDDADAFRLRSHLVHEWRKFLFRDPGLPGELLPADWPGHTAADYFDREAARLLPAATRFVDHCLQRRDP
jgi:phenylacetic acid degradation operon negative regulatory protein